MGKPIDSIEYGIETWVLTERVINQVATFERKILRKRILETKPNGHIRNKLMKSQRISWWKDLLTRKTGVPG